jgi:hypothetical protein
MAKANVDAEIRSQSARAPRYEPSAPPDAEKLDPSVRQRDFDLQHLLEAMETVKIGDFSVRLPRDYVGVPGKVADAFNEIVAANQQMAEQLARVGLVSGARARRATACASRSRRARGARWRTPSTR